MGFFKKLFGSSEDDDAELRAARARHGIDLEDDKKSEKEKSPEDEPYDVWEDLKEMRLSFWVGSWASRKIRKPRLDGLKKELEELERKREAEEKEKGENN